jgi:CRISPR-associated protein Cmr3
MSWDEAYSRMLGVRMRGPYLRKGSVIYVEDRVDGKFIRLEDVEEYCSLKRDLSKGSEEKLREILSRGFSPRVLTVTGIGLKTRREILKVADEDRGLIYTATFIDYLSDMELDTTIELDLVSGEIETGRYVVRLGGEGRVSLLEVSEADSYICDIPERAHLLYVLSPILYETGRYFVEILRKEIGEAEVYGKIDLLGTGYSEIRKRRKPIYQALLPGSVIFLERGVGGREIYEKGIGVGRELGFGSVIPVGGERR